jgi:two-component system sensor histidine kinase UhpB
LQDTLMKRRPLESTSLAVAAVLLALGGGAGLVQVLHVAPVPAALLFILAGLAVACALSLLWIRRLYALRDEAANAYQRLHADEAGQRQQAQRELAISELKLQEIISIMPMTLFIKDTQSRILMMNKAAEQQFGFDFSAVSGSQGQELFPPEQMAVFLANDLAAFSRGQLVVQEDLAYSHARGENRQLQTFKKPVFDADTGEPHFLICMSVDVTERKRAEQALQQSYLQLRQLMAHLEAAKDEEHRRLAADIHDELGQNLMALKIDIEMLHARVGDAHPLLRRKVGRALETLDTSIRSVRAVMNELHPSTLELGLPAALEWLAGQFEQRSGIATTLRISGAASGEIDRKRVAALFRIVQEALLDILRHAEAMQVEMTADFGVEQLSITIADDGLPTAARAPGACYGLGLRGIRERVELFGGQVRVEQRGAGGGTRLSIVVPVTAGPVELASLDLII